MNVDKVVEEAILGHASTREAMRWAMRQAYSEGIASGIEAERKACMDLCDKIEKEAYRMYRKNYDAYEDGVSAGARACMEEIARRGK